MSTTARAIEEIEDVGYTIIPDIISQSRLFEAQQDAEKLLHTIPAKGLNGTNIDGRMCKGLFAKTREFDDIAANSTIMAIVNGILHPDSRPVYYGPKRGAQLGSAMIKDVQPGEDIRALHRDDNYPLPHPHPPLIVNSLLALDPFNNETGGTWVVPRSHTWSGDVSSTSEHVTVTMDPGSIVLFNGPHPHPPLIVNSLLALDPFNDETGGTWVVPRSHTWSGDVSSTTEHVTVTMDPGSIVLFNGALWHGRGPNYTPDQTRRALNLLYNCSWLRPWEGEHLGIPENEWNSLPPAVKAIL